MREKNQGECEGKAQGKNILALQSKRANIHFPYKGEERSGRSMDFFFFHK